MIATRSFLNPTLNWTLNMPRPLSSRTLRIVALAASLLSTLASAADGVGANAALPTPVPHSEVARGRATISDG